MKVMKKAILISVATSVAVLLLIMFVSYSGFSSATTYYAHEPTEPISSFSPLLRQTTMQYGSTYTIENLNGPLFAYIVFPTANNFADAPIFAWVYDVYQTAIDNIMFLRTTDSSIMGELNIQFDSYLLENSPFASVVLKGALNVDTAETANIIRTFNLNLESETFLETWDIFDRSQAEYILQNLSQRLVIARPELSTRLPTLNVSNVSLLENVAIGNNGIHVILELSEVVAGYFGTLEVIIPYADIYSALLIDVGISSEQQPVIAGVAEIDPSRPMVALTFDDGPSMYTPQILDILERYEVNATFFVIGNLVERRIDVVRRASESGSDVFGHSWDHSDLTRLSTAAMRQQLLDTANIIERATGVYPYSFRPTYGRVNNDVLNIAQELDFSMFNWSIDTEDWKSRNADAIYQHVIDRVTNSDIILFHDLYSSTVEAIEMLVPELLARGYQLVTISELMHYSGVEVEPGRVIRHGNRYVNLN
ncbi:MAG: polysaccharide deacetylase family protein [Firmicutes bacterium]|nr:polysaccharide deacetylase family protein [Bacillota bacterium]